MPYIVRGRASGLHYHLCKQGDRTSGITASMASPTPAATGEVSPEAYRFKELDSAMAAMLAIKNSASYTKMVAVEIVEVAQ